LQSIKEGDGDVIHIKQVANKVITTLKTETVFSVSLIFAIAT